ncbi:MAG: hypothetical protein GXN97_06070 [Aquificae bacterium]|nr:hypothetical protein [Aquificota bacterium]
MDISFKSLARLFREKKLITIASKNTPYRFQNGKLTVFRESFDYKNLLGVIFLEKPSSPPRVRKVPLIFLRPFEVKNISLQPTDETVLKALLYEVCIKVGQDLQKFLSKYLIHKGGGITVLARGKRKSYYKRVNMHFIPFYVDCKFNLPIEQYLARINHYLRETYYGELNLYARLSLATGILIAHAWNIELPEPKEYLPLWFLPSAYALTQMLDLKEKTYGLESYAKIPPRGAVMAFYNELINNEPYQEFLLRDLINLQSKGDFSTNYRFRWF